MGCWPSTRLLEVKEGSYRAFLVLATHCCLVNPAWLEHKPLRQSTHLEPELALTLEGQISSTWDQAPGQLQLNN